MQRNEFSKILFGFILDTKMAIQQQKRKHLECALKERLQNTVKSHFILLFFFGIFSQCIYFIGKNVWNETRFFCFVCFQTWTNKAHEKKNTQTTNRFKLKPHLLACLTHSFFRREWTGGKFVFLLRKGDLYLNDFFFLNLESSLFGFRREKNKKKKEEGKMCSRHERVQWTQFRHTIWYLRAFRFYHCSLPLFLCSFFFKYSFVFFFHHLSMCDVQNF